MTMTTQDAFAGSAPRDDNARTLQCYRQAAPFLLLWGAIMFLANGANQFVPPVQQGLVLGLFSIVGVVGSVWLARRVRRQSGFNWRYLATLVAVFIFVGAVATVLRPLSPLQINVFIKLLFCLFYAVGGIWLGLRFLLTGLVVGALTLFAFFNVTDYFNLFMAVAYGGALILTGLWLRRA